jgi:translation initiation factor IF-2
MSVAKRVNALAIEVNVGSSHVIDFLKGKGIAATDTTKLQPDQVELVYSHFAPDMAQKQAVDKRHDELAKHKEERIQIKEEAKKIEPVAEVIRAKVESAGPKVVGNLKEIEEEKAQKKKAAEDAIAKAAAEASAAKLAEEAAKKKASTPAPEVIRAKADSLSGPKVLGSIKEVEAEKARQRKETATREAAEAEEKAAAATKAASESAAAADPVSAEETAAPLTEAAPAPEDEVIRAKAETLSGPKVLGRMELPVEKERKPKPVASSTDDPKKKRKRKRVGTEGGGGNGQAGAPGGIGTHQAGRGPRPGEAKKPALTDEEIQKQVKETLARLSSGGGKSKSSKYRKEKREEIARRTAQHEEELERDKSVLRVTEFVTANELAKMMDVPVTKVISACMSLGLFVSINQRLDAETLTIVAEEFGYQVEFVSAEVQDQVVEREDTADELQSRPPIVTVMGHVDHGKTSLLDFVRKANVIAGEAGGITQHIGAYNVELANGKRITFLDTPGHEAFTAMRARGAKVTDVVIVVIAADDAVMPQTVEAINHAQAAGVPIVFAISKIDKPGANADKIREQLSQMNILVEDWGGKYQVQEISAKAGTNVELLLEKVLLEAELLDLKANPEKNAVGTVIESELDKGRGYVSTVLVQAGTLSVGDVLLAGCHSGRVKALFNERGQTIESAGPATPVQILGLSGAPQAGDRFNVMDDEREAKNIANKRLQLQREQGLRTQKHITLDEIGRRLAIGDFKELNLIVKGDVDGSVEALSDSLLKLSTEKIQVNIILKSVGQITESDVLLASASDAIIIGFQVRPSLNARKLAENEQIQIRQYSIIYDAIEEVKAAMEGMLAPEFEEKIVGNIEVRDVFKISKVGTVAGCMVLDGKVGRNTKVRVIRDGIVMYNGGLASLKRFKDDVKEVSAGYECGLNIEKFNDIKVGDIIEGYENVQVKAKL